MSRGDIVDALRQQGEAAMRATPGLRHHWLTGKDGLVLRLPATSPEGFDVELEAKANGLELRCGSMHTPLDVGGADAEAAVQDALGLLRDLLGPGMRLREKCAGGHAYRWFLETTAAAGWQVEYETTLLLWNLLGRRSERIYRNTHLPAREP